MKMSFTTMLKETLQLQQQILEQNQPLGQLTGGVFGAWSVFAAARVIFNEFKHVT